MFSQKIGFEVSYPQGTTRAEFGLKFGIFEQKFKTTLHGTIPLAVGLSGKLEFSPTMKVGFNINVKIGSGNTPPFLEKLTEVIVGTEKIVRIEFQNEPSVESLAAVGIPMSKAIEAVKQVARVDNEKPSVSFGIGVSFSPPNLLEKPMPATTMSPHASPVGTFRPVSPEAQRLDLSFSLVATGRFGAPWRRRRQSRDK
jgi:hypothetical protein